MDRRNALKALAASSGAVISLPTFTSLFLACNNDSATGYKPQLFTKENYKYFTAFADALLPHSQSMAGAVELKVPEMIDKYNFVVIEKEGHKGFLEKKQAFLEHLKSKGFLDMATEKKYAFLAALGNSNNKEEESAKNGYFELRGLTTYYYTQTAEIAKKHLGYLPVPGKYIPCATVEELGGKRWYID